MIGTKVQLRTKEYIVPSLSFDEVVEFSTSGLLDKVPANGVTMLANPEFRDAAMAVLLTALRWNYPEITREELGKELDLDNCERAMAAVMGTTRLLHKETDTGEAKP